MRLIDADEVKEMGATCFARRNENGELEAIISIDNAPTVDTDEIYKKGYHNGFFATHDVPPTVEPTYISDMPDDKVKDLQELAIDYGEGIAVFERKRLQGEWIYDGFCFSTSKYKCSVCGLPELIKSDYCPNCGARMGGET